MGWTPVMKDSRRAGLFHRSPKKTHLPRRSMGPGAAPEVAPGRKRLPGQVPRPHPGPNQPTRYFGAPAPSTIQVWPEGGSFVDRRATAHPQPDGSAEAWAWQIVLPARLLFSTCARSKPVPVRHTGPKAAGVFGRSTRRALPATALWLIDLVLKLVLSRPSQSGVMAAALQSELCMFEVPVFIRIVSPVLQVFGRASRSGRTHRRR
jgi:hypothetical protein